MALLRTQPTIPINDLFYKRLETPIGSMVALADKQAILLLTFLDDPLESVLTTLQEKLRTRLVLEETTPLISIETELKAYFNIGLSSFKTPLFFHGTSFQMTVWKELKKIPFGKTCSYSSLAQAIGHPTAFRAAAQANGANHFPIVIPCHRVINLNGKLGGYSSGLKRKEWLLHHEHSYV